MNPISRKILFQCFLLSAIFFSPLTEATVVDFEDVVPSSVSEPCFESSPVGCTLSSLDSTGFRFTSPDNGFSNHAHLVSSPFEAPFVNAGMSFPSNGTQYIGLDSTVLAMQRIDGGTFSFSAFDAAEGFKDGAVLVGDVKRLRVDGSLRDGGVVSALFDFDGIDDGTGPLADFQNFLLPATFSNLLTVTFTGLNATGNPSQAIFSIDNLNVNVTPEPGSLTLLGLGVAALGMIRRRTC